MTRQLEEIIARLRDLPDEVQHAVAAALAANLDAIDQVEADRTRDIDGE